MSDKTLHRAPEVNPESEPFWTAASEGRLLIGHCAACAQPHYYPRSHCPHCGSSEVEWRDAAGSGQIYSFVNVARGPNGPFTVAYVTLDEGVSLLTHVVTDDARALQIGDRVALAFAPSDGGAPYPVFKPA